MPLTRVTNWATGSFHDFLKERAAAPFAWGVNDCALFAADAVQAITGTDIAEDFRGKYSSEAEAFALIAAVTGVADATVADAAAYCAAKFGLKEYVSSEGRPQPLFAKRGDLVVIEDAGRMIAGVVHLNGRDVVSVGEGGLKRLALANVQRAWAV